MKQGDFTSLAQAYRHRPGYHPGILETLTAPLARRGLDRVRVADVGAGSGKLTEQLLGLGLRVTAVEPNDAMRAEGVRATRGLPVSWVKGTGESTGLPDASMAWLTMASAFHWTDPTRSVPEFGRVVEAGGRLTVLWNPRDLESSPWHMELERAIHAMAPGVERRSSGAAKYTEGIESVLTASGHFTDPIFMEGRHELTMTRERYMGAWRSVNDFPAQVGEARWQEILAAIEAKVADLDEIVVPYRTRAWTVARAKSHGAR